MRGHCSASAISRLVLVMLLLAVVASLGCGDGGDGNGNGGGWAAAMMDKVPEDAAKFMFTFTDLAGMRSDGDLDELYDDYSKEIESECEALGISPDDVDRTSKGYSGYIFVIFEGRFDLGDVREVLEDKGYQEGEYKKVQTWENNSADVEAVALVNKSCIVIGDDIDNLEDSIDVIKGDVDSLSDDEDISYLMSVLPAGLVASASTYYATYPGCEVTGYSLKKKDSSTLLLTMLLLFEDEDAANAAMEDVQSDHSNQEVTKQGKYITVIAESDIE